MEYQPTLPLVCLRRSDAEWDVMWREVAARYPEFAQWIVQKFGPLPDGPVLREDYERFSAARASAHQEGSGE